MSPMFRGPVGERWLTMPERPIAELAVLGAVLALLGLALWLTPALVPVFCIVGGLSCIFAAAAIRLRRDRDGGSN